MKYKMYGLCALLISASSGVLPTDQVCACSAGFHANSKDSNVSSFLERVNRLYYISVAIKRIHGKQKGSGMLYGLVSYYLNNTLNLICSKDKKEVLDIYKALGFHTDSLKGLMLLPKNEDNEYVILLAIEGAIKDVYVAVKSIAGEGGSFEDAVYLCLKKAVTSDFDSELSIFVQNLKKLDASLVPTLVKERFEYSEACEISYLFQCYEDEDIFLDTLFLKKQRTEYAP